MTTSKVFILLPAYNEQSALTRLIPDIARVMQNQAGRPFEICVVNDGSRDGTVALAESFPEQYGVHCLNHEKNKGYGVALSTGYQWIIAHGHAEDLVIAMDADNTHPPTEIPALLQKLEQDCDVVTASYMLPGGTTYGVPVIRRIMSRTVNGLFHFLLPVPGVRMYTNGYRGYRLGILQKIYATYGSRLIEETGFPGGAELFLKVCHAGGRAGEVPFSLHYENRGSESKIHVSRTITGYLKLIRRIRWLP